MHYLPPDSPNLNPIERFCSSLKTSCQMAHNGASSALRGAT
ncbi:transposase [Xenorhabdus nematophila]